MPIKGLTDQGPTFPKIGDIRKGAKKTEEKRPGRDLEWFRYVPIEGEEDAAEIFAREYGDQPKEIDILLPFPDVDKNFDAWMERHTAGALQCRSDGETVIMWRDDNGEMRHDPKPCPGNCEGCKATGRLKVIIPKLRRLAFVVVHTTSVWDIAEIYANLRALRQMTGNGVNGIPLVLKRRPREISTPRDGGKRIRQTKWLLCVEADQSWVEAQLAALKVAALPSPTVTASPVVEDDAVDDDIEEYDGEFEPEPEPEGDELFQAALELEGATEKLVVENITDFWLKVGELGIDEKKVHGTLRMPLNVWCEKHSQGLTGALATVREAVGK